MPNAAALLRQARLRAKLSQRALAERAGTAQSVVARIERGQTSPTWQTLERLLEAAGAGMSAGLASPIEDGSMLYEVPGMLRMTPEQRLQGVENVSDFLFRARRVSDGSGVPGATAPLDLQLLFTALARHNVEFVLIGALGATLHGFPRNTRDADITPARDRANLQRLAAALRELDARVFTEKVPEGLPFDCSAPMLARADVWNLITKAGRLDLAFQPSGTGGFTDLASHAVRFEVYGIHVLTARLEDIIRSKEAADRPKDRQDVVVMREMLKNK
ncbi:MAG TPA: helix-turn-helix transcriptional regulator [Gemmatimonadales bacterium]|nr:helix-turn-helix transcriptional regulator [Gemmatimonadales bacterium]